MDSWTQYTKEVRTLMDSDPAQAGEYIEGLPDHVVLKLAKSPHIILRPKQIEVLESTADTILVLCGRGWGKTLVGSHWLHRHATTQPTRLGLVAETAADVRDDTIDGVSGIKKAVHQPPLYEPSKRRLTWEGGSTCTTYSGEKPDQLRGLSASHVWIDELAKYAYQDEAWEQVEYVLREGEQSQALITTTPRPTDLIKRLAEDDSVHVVTGTSFENRQNLSARFLRKLRAAEKTRLGRQEVHAEILGDVPGALWSDDTIRHIRRGDVPALDRIVVAVDPSVSEKSRDEAGIVVAGVAGERAYVLADFSGQYTPRAWARVAVAAYKGDMAQVSSIIRREYEWGPADLLVAEKNQGGGLVKSTIHSIDSRVAYKGIWAKRGKKLRAQPVSSLYEGKRIFHVGYHTELESQMRSWDPENSKDSPDRVDALVYGITELLLQEKTGLTGAGILDAF